MGYVNLFINWKNQNLESMKKQVSASLKAKFIFNGSREVNYNYCQTINLLKKRFEKEQDWTFEVLKSYTRSDEQIVVTDIIRENHDYALIEPLAVCLLTFKNQKLIRLHMEAELVRD
ncbi:hypothetical protein BHU61_11085 [Macrococcus epidermidis]|uniref:Uncharacterized protein n=1 Tax=Macrococcus epidermidis TaxID=1902580 RepID=A0A327ZND4_9STAP|nr:hypothetical protein [Macrococcus epidermidis]RAK43891.1 hypothetical protein BHU61_11085 [Macrococcus epidermidis]